MLLQYRFVPLSHFRPLTEGKKEREEKGEDTAFVMVMMQRCQNLNRPLLLICFEIFPLQ